MKGLNKVQLIGNLGKDPEIRTTPKDASFTLAANRTFRNKDGESIEDTQWFNLEAWKGLASVIEEHLKRGDRIYIEGRLKTEPYQKDGETKYFTKVVVQEMIMLGRSGLVEIVAGYYLFRRSIILSSNGNGIGSPYVI